MSSANKDIVKQILNQNCLKTLFCILICVHWSQIVFFIYVEINYCARWFAQQMSRKSKVCTVKIQFCHPTPPWFNINSKQIQILVLCKYFIYIKSLVLSANIFSSALKVGNSKEGGGMDVRRKGELFDKFFIAFCV